MGRVAEVKVQAHTRREEAGMKFSGIGSQLLQGSAKKSATTRTVNPPQWQTVADWRRSSFVMSAIGFGTVTAIRRDRTVRRVEPGFPQRRGLVNPAALGDDAGAFFQGLPFGLEVDGRDERERRSAGRNWLLRVAASTMTSAAPDLLLSPLPRLHQDPTVAGSSQTKPSPKVAPPSV